MHNYSVQPPPHTTNSNKNPALSEFSNMHLGAPESLYDTI